MDFERIFEHICESDFHNEVYFCMSRSQYLKSGEKRGVLTIQITDFEHYLKYLKKEKSDSRVRLFYDTNFNYPLLEQYNPDVQFVVNLKLEDKESTEIINKKNPRNIYYGKTMSLSGTIINQDEHVLSTPCINCDENEKVPIEELPYTSSKCSCCDKMLPIKYMYECTNCCTQYIYS